MRSEAGVVERSQRWSGKGRRLRFTCLLSTITVSIVISASARATDAADAKKIFNRCTACHTFGRGVKVGPDLKGVTSRRTRQWLLQFIRSSQGLIQAREPTATALFERFKQERMPDWTDLSEAQIDALLDWISNDGPDQREADERDAELATASDIERARGLFVGTSRLANGGLACGACHSIREN